MPDIIAAGLHILQTGPFRGRRVHNIALRDDGLLELQRLAGEEEAGEDHIAAVIFTSHPPVQGRIQQVFERGDSAYVAKRREAEEGRQVSP